MTIAHPVAPLAPALRSPRTPVSWVLSLYFAQGLPFFMVNAVAGLMLKALGVGNDEIARWTGVLGLAWVFKPLWSPLLEMAPSKKWLVVAFQFIGAAALAAMALALQLPAFFAAAIVVLAVVSLASASHDIACDGLYIASLKAKSRAVYAGWLGACFNGAKLFATGALLIMAGALEPRLGVVGAWCAVFLVAAALMALLAAYHVWALPDTREVPDAAAAAAPHGGVAGTLADVLASFFRLPGVWIAIAFIVLFRAGEAQVQTIGPLFLKEARTAGGLGLDTAQVGWSYGAAGTLAFLAGSILSGYFTAWLGLKRALLPLVVAMNLPNLAFYLLALWQPQELWLISAAVSLETFGYGFGFVAVILFMMQFVAGSRYPTAHYALATGVMALGYVLFKTLSGDLQQAMGYQPFFLWVLATALPVFVLLRWLPLRDEPAAAATAGGAG
jgi:MFS transporter, PAT family, beta-lactamase induction signal transducer AmpG